MSNGMKSLCIGLLVFACWYGMGLVGAAGNRAYYAKQYPMLNCSHRGNRQEVVLQAVFAVGGPFWLTASAIGTGGFMDGFRWSLQRAGKPSRCAQ